MTIEEIHIQSEKFPPIQKDSTLSRLADFNVIVGENSSGKTRLFQAVQDKYEGDSDVQVIYLKGVEIIAKEELKATTDTTLLIKAVVSLFSESDFTVPVNEETKNTITRLRDALESGNEQFQKVTDNEEMGLKGIENIGTNSLKLEKKEWLARSIVPKDLTSGIEKEGQGYQRLLIAFLIKALSEASCHGEEQKREILLLFEEPESFLHQKLKKALKRALIAIAKEDCFTVIITTHDAFFANDLSSEEGVSFKRYSLVKDNDKTEIREDYAYGVESELMHVFLYSRVKKEKIDGLEKHVRPYIKDTGEERQLALPVFIRHQIHHPSSDNKNTVGLISDDQVEDCEGKNYYTEAELEESIKALCTILYGESDSQG